MLVVIAHLLCFVAQRASNNKKFEFKMVITTTDSVLWCCTLLILFIYLELKISKQSRECMATYLTKYCRIGIANADLNIFGRVGT
jgi:hypothetical protein